MNIKMVRKTHQQGLHTQGVYAVRVQHHAPSKRSSKSLNSPTLADAVMEQVRDPDVNPDVTDAGLQ